MLILARADVPKGRFTESLPAALVAALREHNRACCAEERIRLRMAVHAGEVSYDRYGVAGAAVNLAFRLVEAHPLKAALASSPGVLAVITSSWFFDEVVRHSPASDPGSYRPVRVAVKETGDQLAARTAWQQALAILDYPSPIHAPGPGRGYPDAGQIRAKLARQDQ